MMRTNNPLSVAGILSESVNLVAGVVLEPTRIASGNYSKVVSYISPASRNFNTASLNSVGFSM